MVIMALWGLLGLQERLDQWEIMEMLALQDHLEDPDQLDP